MIAVASASSRGRSGPQAWARAVSEVASASNRGRRGGPDGLKGHAGPWRAEPHEEMAWVGLKQGGPAQGEMVIALTTFCRGEESPRRCVRRNRRTECGQEIYQWRFGAEEGVGVSRRVQEDPSRQVGGGARWPSHGALQGTPETLSILRESRTASRGAGHHRSSGIWERGGRRGFVANAEEVRECEFRRQSRIQSRGGSPRGGDRSNR